MPKSCKKSANLHKNLYKLAKIVIELPKYPYFSFEIQGNLICWPFPKHHNYCLYGFTLFPLAEISKGKDYFFLFIDIFLN